MEILIAVIVLLIILNAVQAWMNVRLIQGKQTGLPMVAEKMLDVIQDNQTQIIAAMRDMAAKTPDPRDDKAVEWLNAALSAFARGTEVTPPQEFTPTS